jgi:hypothetical protein
MAKKIFPIRYTNRDFDSIKSDLIEYTQRYYSDIFQDFNEASFGALMLDTVSYVGDILSFYLDYQTNESFIDTATEYENVLRLGRQFGYKYKQNQVSYGEVSLYVLVPATVTGGEPDKSYLPILKKGSRFSSTSGGIFTLNQDVNFAKENNEFVVARVDSNTGAPTYFAAKAKGRVISGQIEEEIIEVRDFQKFLRLELASPNITEIISIHDSEGNQYYEVDYLTQNIVYRSIRNNNSDKKKVSSVLKSFAVARRFVVEQDRYATFLQFGHGSDSEMFNDAVADPSKVLLKTHGKEHITDDSFDPSNLIATDKFGIGPSNTKLRILYRTNTVTNSNAASNSVTTVDHPKFVFNNKSSLAGGSIQTIIDSLEVTNEKKMLGDVSSPTLDEVKTRIKGLYAAQNRAVTKEDYMNVVYSMSSEFGSIKRCNIFQDNDSFKRNINIFIACEDENRNLTPPTATLEQNLVTWLNNYKMINDTIDILPAKIVNFGIEYKILGDMKANKYDVLSRVTDTLKRAFSKTYDIGQHLVISDIYKIINSVRGVTDTLDVRITNKFTDGYSDVRFDINQNISADGRILDIPKDHVLEMRLPSDDIVGTIK